MASTACPAGSYQFCTNGPTDCSYRTSDGQAFYCVACNDCNAAATRLGNWCQSTTVVRDFSTNKPPPDLSMPLVGCNGYLTCLQTAADATAQAACDAKATPQAMNLLSAVDTCITTACFNTNNADSGTPFCMSDTDNSTICTGCIQKSIAVGGACVTQFNACRNDKP
jgi:hypothetical protein